MYAYVCTYFFRLATYSSCIIILCNVCMRGSDSTFLDLLDNSTGEFLIPKHFTFLGQVEVYTISYTQVQKGICITQEDLLKA